MAKIDNIVVVTKKTWLEELIQKYNTKSQAKFYIESMGGNFEEYELAHKAYHESLARLKKSIPYTINSQVVEREFLPNFLFGPNDLVVTIGQDGLVINTAKYLDDQLLLAVNPDPKRIDGILIPFSLEDFNPQLKKILDDEEAIKKMSLAQAELSTNQKVIGINDIFIGHSSHMSARYSVTYRGKTEKQSSSGIIISTGVGSTGWLKAVVYGAARIVNGYHTQYKIEAPNEKDYRFPWDANFLYFVVREPWPSKISGSSLVYGKLYKNETLEIESHMSDQGVIFSDGIEKDYVEFLSGTIAKIGLAEKKVNLILNNLKKK